MIQFLLYIISVSLGIIFCKKTKVLKGISFSYLLLILYPKTTAVVAVVLGLEVVAAIMDIENNMEVYDIFHILSAIILVGNIILKHQPISLDQRSRLTQHTT